MTLKQYFKRALSLSPRVVFIKALQLATRLLKSYFVEVKDLTVATFSPIKNHKSDFKNVFPVSPAIDDLIHFQHLKKLVDLTFAHKFDLLGSGWADYGHHAKPTSINNIAITSDILADPKHDPELKFINWSNRKHAIEVRSEITSEYNPIDWHRDIKSGYRWKPSTWWLRIPYGHQLGVDVKMPWELSRCHHLTWLALGYIAENDQSQKIKLLTEFKNQILDFISTNPTRFGVNWRCPMDVAIRSANWILAYDWFKQNGANFSPKFDNIFAAYLEDQGDFIFKNLEIGSDKFRGNHYLADICGLSFISFFLPNSPKTKNWKHFCHAALLEEMDYQFFEDGSNFEGSTSYHRLSAEMIFYTFLLYQNEKEIFSFSGEFVRRIIRFADFSQTVHWHEEQIVQIGDCDNGRFFKIQPLFIQNDINNENHLTHKCLISAIHGYFHRATDESLVESLWLKKVSLKMRTSHELKETDDSTSFLNQSSNKADTSDSKTLLAIIETIRSNSSITNLQTEVHRISAIAQYKSKILPIDSSNLVFHAYPKFGLFIWKNQSTFFSFRAGKVGQKERGGHDHNDQLSIVLIQNGQMLISDPGTGIYTPFPETRNAYRSAESHCGPNLIHKGVRLEAGALDQGLFSMNSKQSSQVFDYSQGLVAAYNPRMETLRVIKFRPDANEIWVVDICFSSVYQLNPMTIPSLKLSKGYGHF